MKENLNILDFHIKRIKTKIKKKNYNKIFKIIDKCEYFLFLSLNTLYRERREFFLLARLYVDEYNHFFFVFI
jgi:hypothetical protein